MNERKLTHEYYVKIFWDRGFWKVLIFDLKNLVGKIKPLGLKRDGASFLRDEGSL